MPLPGDVSFDLDEWLRDEATRPDGSFVALEHGDVVGYAGLLEHANGSAVAEHGLTVVRRDRRRGESRTRSSARNSSGPREAASSSSSPGRRRATRRCRRSTAASATSIMPAF